MRSAGSRSLLGVSAGGMAAMAAAGLLVGLRDVVDNANVALLLAVVVVVAAGFGGRLAGGLTAVLAAVSFDFLHTRPYGSLKIANADDLLTAALLVVVGLLAGELADRLEVALHRRSHLGELQRLRRVTSSATSGQSDDALAEQVAAELTGCLGLRTCWFEPTPFLGELPVIEPDGSLSTRTYRWGPGGFELPREGVALPLCVRGRLQGRFVLASTEGVAVPIERRLVALALVDHLAAVLAVRAA